jgi:hypothetical protein
LNKDEDVKIAKKATDIHNVKYEVPSKIQSEVVGHNFKQKTNKSSFEDVQMDKASSNFKMPKEIGEIENLDSNNNDSDHDSGDELINVGSHGGQAQSLGK